MEKKDGIAGLINWASFLVVLCVASGIYTFILWFITINWTDRAQHAIDLADFRIGLVTTVVLIIITISFKKIVNILMKERKDKET
ncbi:MAG: hypothetical protein P4L45_15905 [Ignavibacteriaceae bacterium]|nr:hypothetical protein [Ignavibacteriaceae bacterium]